ncbi:MAG: recombinase family protein [Ruminococcus sp.]|nr:recombinase family protein [Ruminococcus sp.]
MLKDVENGLVGTVIVKDQSRHGRDHLETDKLMEIVFPAYDVRFIAVTDGVDSANGFNEMSGIKNYFNDFYARDTSKKIRAVFRAKGERGERVGTSIPYGYMKNPDNPKQLIPDPVTAPVVRQIYELCADGKGTRAICRYLEEHEIESPGVYEFHTRGTKSKHPDLEHPYLWAQQTVRDMLSNRIYCGDTVNFQTYSKSNKLKKRIKNDPENILIFENTHEPIVSRELFALVQKHYEGRKRPDRQGDTDKYAGYVYCADCGSKMYLNRGKSIKPENNYYQCGGYQTKGGRYCTVHRIKANVLDRLVFKQLRDMTAYAREKPEEFYEIAARNGRETAELEKKESEKKRIKTESRIKELDNILSCLYEDKALGKITPERYDKLSSGYEKEQTELVSELAKLSTELDSMERRDECISEFIENAKANLEIKEITPNILKTFISRIDVYENPEKYSRSCGNMILIHYTFPSLNKSEPVLPPIADEAFTQAAC